ncbi:saccharopine dehydrogenase NADP-binding domain-containing protein [Cellulomonas sp. Sa3CUA2]|uniref:Saccharopine dehydrogenase NADP-binding domain-containing protein n=1 Tax=Cellulomonas avistercoris TaxID=2762242 RepID=A0ABR8QCE4_9CELL|nr:saccharopine dehydrogenase NADP-binding domain-containing protein [Cellulomonas avistercoris]MBD7918070.1 saccharopine dehydrogenase NADP-binding domain-containing protein [Cellulomonas avistercoris]
MAGSAREHDVVVLGATGFVGTLVAEHLARAAPAGTRIALAGRSRDRLARVRARLPAGAQGWPLVVADVDDDASLRALAAATQVVVTTVGPYLRSGLPVVEACARAGTHYADLTGEVPFVRRATDAHGEVARATGARLVHACGYDAVPSDLAVLALHRRVAADDAGTLGHVRLVASARGGVSGGTVASVRGIAELAVRDASVRRLLADPYALSPDRAAEPATTQPRDTPAPGRTVDGRWVATSPMGSFNTRVVRRSNALQGWAYGRDLRYEEVAATGRGLRGAAAAVGLTVGLPLALAALTVPPARTLLDRVLPAPGTGPDAATRRDGWFRMDVHAVTTTGRRYRALAAGQGDPGYAATAVMLGEAALALALDGHRLPDRAGSLTPTTGVGDVLVERLRAAGHTYEAAER